MSLKVSRCGRFLRRPFGDEPWPEEKDESQCCRWAWQEAVCLAKFCLEGASDVGGGETWDDPSVYVGTAGLAIMCLALAKAELADSTEYDYFKTLAKEYIKQTEANMSKFHHRHDESIVCGTSGSLLAGIYVQHHFGCVEHQSVLEFHRIISRSDSQVNEFLYGRAGSLYGLLSIKKILELQEDVPEAITFSLDDEIRKLSSVILQSGRQYAQQRRRLSSSQKNQDISPSQVTTPPLFWEFHGKPYIGACHGALGILGILLQVPKNMWTEMAEWESAHKDIIATLDFLVSCWNNEEQNFPSRLGSSNYDLVQWCHGASGAVLCFAIAFEATHSQTYLDVAIRTGEVVWERGLLTKGFGLCHGISGNAYAFLALYRITSEEKYLRRAFRFARFITESVSSNASLVYEPDHPFSLFEGLAGAVCLLVELACYNHRPNGKLYFYSLNI